VSGTYDDVVKERITQKDHLARLFLDKSNHKVWVKSWAEFIRDCEARLRFVQDKLKIEVSAEEIEDRITQLKTSILKTETEIRAEPTSDWTLQEGQVPPRRKMREGPREQERP
jgi:hypothetical protein